MSFIWNILFSSIGHVDPGEDDFTTALRETKEEAGYLITQTLKNSKNLLTFVSRFVAIPKQISKYFVMNAKR